MTTKGNTKANRARKAENRPLCCGSHEPNNSTAAEVAALVTEALQNPTQEGLDETVVRIQELLWNAAGL